MRECDVMEALIRDRGGRLDPALANALTPLCEALAAARDAAHSRFVAELCTKRYTRMCERLANPLLRRALPATLAGCDAPAMNAPIARSVRRAGKRIGREAPPEYFARFRLISFWRRHMANLLGTFSRGGTDVAAACRRWS